MDKYISTKLNIYEAYDNGYITESEKYELLYIIEYDNITNSELVLEKKTRDEYAREKFKKKYNFVPDKDEKYGDRGTITVKGEKVPVTLSKSKLMNHYGNKPSMTDMLAGNALQRQAKVNVADDSITLDKNVFKLKNQKRRDAIFQHELAHRNFQFPSSAKDKQVPEIRKQNIEQANGIFKQLGMSDEDIANNKKVIADEVNRVLLHNKKYDTKNKERSDALKMVDSKHKSKTNYHVNGLEKEADIIAAKNTSRKDLTKGINEYYKRVRKDTKKALKPTEALYGKQIAKQAITKFNTDAAEDFSKRAKSLKDNSLYNIDYYNKNH